MTHKIIQSSCHSTYTMLNKLDKMLRKQFVSHHVHCQCHLFYTFEEFWIFKPFRSNSFDRSANARRTFASWDWTSWWGSKYLSRKYRLFPKNDLFLKKPIPDFQHCWPREHPRGKHHGPRGHHWVPGVATAHHIFPEKETLSKIRYIFFSKKGRRLLRDLPGRRRLLRGEPRPSDLRTKHRPAQWGQNLIK